MILDTCIWFAPHDGHDCFILHIYHVRPATAIHLHSREYNECNEEFIFYKLITARNGLSYVDGIVVGPTLDIM